MQDKRLVSFENDFYETEADLRAGNPDAIAAITVDGYPEDKSESGSVVCRIWLTRHGDVIVDAHDTMYMDDPTVRNLIDESKDQLLRDFASREARPGETVPESTADPAIE